MYLCVTVICTSSFEHTVKWVYFFVLYYYSVLYAMYCIRQHYLHFQSCIALYYNYAKYKNHALLITFYFIVTRAEL